jgi:hypothetical protein
MQLCISLYATKPHSQVTKGSTEKISMIRPHSGQVFSTQVGVPLKLCAPGHL